MSASDPLDIVTERIRALVDDKRRPVDWLAATFQVVEIMTERQARIVYDALVNKPLAVHDADLLQMVAQRLGITITWQHIDLAPFSQWEEGRGT